MMMMMMIIIIIKRNYNSNNDDDDDYDNNNSNNKTVTLASYFKIITFHFWLHMFTIYQPRSHRQQYNFRQLLTIELYLIGITRPSSSYCYFMAVVVNVVGHRLPTTHNSNKPFIYYNASLPSETPWPIKPI